MPGLPRERGLDHTLALLREGYAFIGRRCERFGSEAFETRIMLRRAVCIRGAAAAEIFYAGDRFTRVGAMPITVLKLLQDRGSVQTLDAAAHRRRKALFMDIMDSPGAEQLAGRFGAALAARLAAAGGPEHLVLFDEACAILARTVAAWAGVPFSEQEAPRRTRELVEMIESTGSVGPRNWRALLLRSRAERWARDRIRRIRDGTLAPAEHAPARRIATHVDADGRPLDVASAGVELLNVLRPTVAVARFIVYAAVALHRHPETRAGILSGDERYLQAFVEEVRRVSPFFPFIGGRVRRAFEWRDHRFEEGTWVLLDLYGTDLDPRSWPEPSAFRPERFLGGAATPFNFVPQGAGDPAVTHRCPGERATVELMKAAVRVLAADTRHRVPDQDLSVDLSRIPALPRSGFILERASA